MGGALGLRAERCDPFVRGLSGAAREQPATVGVGPARTVGGVLWGPRGTRTANGRGVRPLGSGTRLEPSSADRPHLGWAYVVVAVWLPTPRRARWLYTFALQVGLPPGIYESSQAQVRAFRLREALRANSGNA